jgi:hypothetical protein
MRTAPIVAKLKEAGCGRVSGGLEMAGVLREPGNLPALYVCPLGEDAAPNRHQGVHDQAVSADFGVVILVAVASRREEAVSDDLAELEEKVIHALIGWAPAEGWSACGYTGGRILSVSGSSLAWLVSFKTGFHIRKVPS